MVRRAWMQMTAFVQTLGGNAVHCASARQRGTCSGARKTFGGAIIDKGDARLGQRGAG